MNSFERQLITAAAQEHWYDPHDDAQFTFEPARLTRLNGVRHVVDLGYISYVLPDKTTPYVLYELMQRSPQQLKFEHNLQTWQRLDRVAQHNEQLIKVFTSERLLPLSTCWVKRSPNRTLLLAVEESPNRPLLRLEKPLYMHISSNDWLAEEGQAIEFPIQSHNALINTGADAGNVLAGWHANTDGNAWLFHNGYYVNDISVAELSAGDSLQLLIDKSGRGYADYPIGNLRHYNSELDGRGKYLIQLPAADATRVEMADEVEIFICNAQANAGQYPRVRGVYYSRLYASDTRMLTHQDFALDARRVEAIIDEHSGEMDWDAPFLRVFMRYHTEPDKVAPAIDNNYLVDLFRVNQDIRANLMLGTVSTFDGWRASTLEKSAVAVWQQLSHLNLNFTNLKGVYAFEELNRRCRAIEWREGNEVLLPFAAKMGGLLQLFKEGLLVDIQRVAPDSEYTVEIVPADVDAVEFLPGRFVESGDGFDRDTDFYGQADWFDERYYWREYDSGDVWLPAVVGQDLHIDEVTGAVTWDSQHSSHERMRRTLRDSIYRRWDILPEMIYHPLDIYTVVPVTLFPLSKLDVYINGHKLVEGIDYRVDYPQVQIYNKEYYLEQADPNTPLKVELFHYGVPEHPGEGPRWGFIRHRMLRDTADHLFVHNRHQHIVVDGRRVDPDQVNHFEAPEYETLPELREGGLYALEPYPWMLGPWARMRLTDGDLGRGEEVGRVLSPLLPDTRTTGPVWITHAHAVFSPWLKRILQAIRSGDIDLDALGDSMTAMRVAVIPYLDELDADIAGQVHGDQWSFIDIHPTPDLEQVRITEEEFLFLRKINTEFLNDRVVMNTYIQVGKEQLP